MSKQEKMSPNMTARLTGFLYLLLVPLGIFGIMYVPGRIIVLDNIVETANNIIANESLFRLSIVSALLVQLVNLTVVLLLYKLLSPVNKNVARMMVLFIVLAIPIAMLNELTNSAALLLAQRADRPLDLIALFLDLHEYGIQIAGIFWGLWLFPMGYLVFRSNYIPKIIGIALMIGCFGYLADAFIFLLFPEFGMTFAEFLFVGEVLLPLWLLIKGVNVEQWQKKAIAFELA